MLTATYSLVAIATEQDKARSLLQRLQQFIETSWKRLQHIDFGFFEAAHQKLLHFDHFLRRRKLEQSLIPMLRQAGREAHQLLAELDAQAEKAASALRIVAREAGARVEMNTGRIMRLSEAMHSYCAYAAARLQLEEQALLPLARRLLSVEDWFRLAAEFLSQGEGRTRAAHSRRAVATSAVQRTREYH